MVRLFVHFVAVSNAFMKFDRDEFFPVVLNASRGRGQALGNAMFCDDNQVEGGIFALQLCTENIAHTTFYPIPDNRIPHLTTYRNPQTACVPICFESVDNEVFGESAFPLDMTFRNSARVFNRCSEGKH